MPTSGSEFLSVDLLVMFIGFVIAFFLHIFFRERARRLPRHEVTQWQKHITYLIVVIITNLIIVFGFSLLFFSRDDTITFIQWVTILKNLVACFGCLLSIHLFFYVGALLYYHSGLDEQVRDRYHIKNWWRRNR